MAASHAHVDMQAKYDASNPDWKKIYGDYPAFQKDRILWFRFVYLRLDQYMQE